MITFLKLSHVLGLTGASLLAFGLVSATGDEPASQQAANPAPAQAQPEKPKRLDPTKTLRIERPPAEIVKNVSSAVPAPVQPSPSPRLDMPKSAVIERPAVALVAGPPAGPPRAGEFVNPKVEPGKVRWHATFAAARAAAAYSGKPVLLFQMMGKLDDQFC